MPGARACAFPRARTLCIRFHKIFHIRLSLSLSLSLSLPLSFTGTMGGRFQRFASETSRIIKAAATILVSAYINRRINLARSGRRMSGDVARAREYRERSIRDNHAALSLPLFLSLSSRGKIFPPPPYYRRLFA